MHLTLVPKKVINWNQQLMLLMLSPISRFSSPLANIWPNHALQPFNKVTYVSTSKGPPSFSGSSANEWVIKILFDKQGAKYINLLVAL